jgi:SAM-dependent methyltransferase
MHGTAIENAEFFFKKFVGSMEVGATIVEFGSQDINGSMRQMVPPEINYIGLDCTQGKHVDIVLDDPYKVPLADESADIVVSSSTLEHVQFFWLLFMEMVRIVKKGGLIYILAPSIGPYHPCPVDCWRFYPGAGQALEAWSKIMGSPVYLQYSHITEFHFWNQDTGEKVSDDEWRDWVVVFKK